MQALLLRTLSTLFAFMLLLSSTVTFAVSNGATQNEDGTAVEDDSGDDEEGANDTINNESEDEENNCDEKRGLERSICRIRMNILNKGEDVPACTIDENLRGLRLAYCKLRSNLANRNTRPDESAGRRSIRRARSAGVRVQARVQRRDFRSEAREAKMELNQRIKDSRTDLRMDIQSRRMHFLEQRQERRINPMRTTDTEMDAMTNEEKEELRIHIRESRDAALREKAQAVQETTKQRRANARHALRDARMQEKQTRKSILKERRTRSRTQVRVRTRANSRSTQELLLQEEEE
jgi:hypothetical protein